MVEVGQVCKKIAGRETGRYCIVIKDEGKFVQISGISKYLMCKNKRCNKKHLIPTKIKIELKGEKQEDIERSLMNSGVIKRLGLEKIKLNKLARKKLENERKRSKMKKPKIKKILEKRTTTKKSGEVVDKTAKKIIKEGKGTTKKILKKEEPVKK